MTTFNAMLTDGAVAMIGSLILWLRLIVGTCTDKGQRLQARERLNQIVHTSVFTVVLDNRVIFDTEFSASLALDLCFCIRAQPLK